MPENQSIVARCASTTGSRRLCPPRTSSAEATKATTTCRLGSSFEGVKISVQVSPTFEEIQQSQCSGAEFQHPPTNTTCLCCCFCIHLKSSMNNGVCLPAGPAAACQDLLPVQGWRGGRRARSRRCGRSCGQSLPRPGLAANICKLPSLFGTTRFKQRHPDVFHRACWPQPACDVDKSLHRAFSGVAVTPHRSRARGLHKACNTSSSRPKGFPAGCVAV